MSHWHSPKVFVSFYSVMLEHWRDKSNSGMTYVHTYNSKNLQILRVFHQGGPDSKQNLKELVLD